MADRFFDLVDGTQLPDFAAWVARRAITDHYDFPKARPSGKDLVTTCCTDWRRLHERMATGIYWNTRRTLAAEARERVKAAV